MTDTNEVNIEVIPSAVNENRPEELHAPPMGSMPEVSNPKPQPQKKIKEPPVPISPREMNKINKRISIIIFGYLIPLASSLGFYRFICTVTLIWISGTERNISDGIGKEFITDISVGNCPSDYSDNIGSWPGLMIGKFYGYYGSISRFDLGKCTEQDCYDVPEMDRILYTKWGDKSICITRAKPGEDYVRRVTCLAGENQCYPGYCFKGSCPITGVRISDTPSLRSVNFGPNKYLNIYNQNKLKNPLGRLDVTYDSMPCYDSKSTNKDNLYPLLNLDRGGCTVYDEKVFLIDQMQEFYQMNNNSIPADLVYPLWTPLTIPTVYLIGREKLLLKNSPLCFDVSAKDVDFDQIYVASAAVKISMIIATTLTSIGTIGFIYLSCTQDLTDKYGKRILWTLYAIDIVWFCWLWINVGCWIFFKNTNKALQKLGNCVVDTKAGWVLMNYLNDILWKMNNAMTFIFITIGSLAVLTLAIKCTLRHKGRFL